MQYAYVRISITKLGCSSVMKQYLLKFHILLATLHLSVTPQIYPKINSHDQTLTQCRTLSTFGEITIKSLTKFYATSPKSIRQHKITPHFQDSPFLTLPKHARCQTKISKFSPLSHLVKGQFQ